MRSGLWVLYGVVLAAALLCSACATNTAGNRVEVDTSSNKTFTEKGDLYLDKRLEITDVHYRDNGGFLEVQASVKNRTKDTIACEFNVQWYDKDGWELQSANSPWRQLIVHGLEQKEVTALAPRAGATRFRLAIREDAAYRP